MRQESVLALADRNVYRLLAVIKAAASVWTLLGMLMDSCRAARALLTDEAAGQPERAGNTFYKQRNEAAAGKTLLSGD